MALILNIDTSTDVCSVAIARDGNLIALKENDEGFNHSTLLGVYVDDLLKENDLTANDLDAVAEYGTRFLHGLAHRGFFS